MVREYEDLANGEEPAWIDADRPPKIWQSGDVGYACYRETLVRGSWVHGRDDVATPSFDVMMGDDSSGGSSTRNGTR